MYDNSDFSPLLTQFHVVLSTGKCEVLNALSAFDRASYLTEVDLMSEKALKQHKGILIQTINDFINSLENFRKGLEDE